MPGNPVEPYILRGAPFVGGFGAGYVAEHPAHLGKCFFVKLPKDPKNPDHVARLRREGRTLAALKHPNVLRLVDCQTDRDPPFLVFEYMEGGSLRDLLRKGVPPVAAGTMLFQIADALSAFHARGGFHRDVNPNNILITGAGAFVLADVGLARLPSPSSIGTRTIMGTPGYVDPWVVNNGYDAAADVWGLGVTFCETLTGLPARRIAPNGELLVALDAIPLPNVRGRKLVHDLIVRMLARERAQRPRAIAVRNYIGALLRGETPPTLAPMPWKPVNSAAIAPQVAAGNSIFPLLFGGALTLVALAVAGNIANGDDGSD